MNSKMKFNTRLFLILFATGMAGVVSMLLVDLAAVLAILPLPADTVLPMPIPMLKVVGLIQPAILLAAAVLIGTALASRVGLSSPVAEAVVSGGDIGKALKSQFFPGIIGGLAGGVSIVLIAAILKPFLPPEVAALISQFANLLPLPVRLLYGGITEELLLRWGFMTFVAWAAWRQFQRGQDRPTSAVFVTAILISSLVFAFGHLPVAFMLVPEPTIALILFVIFGNSAFGLVAGYLYWKKGLESAMIAHALAHVVMFTASYYGAYF